MAIELQSVMHVDVNRPAPEFLDRGYEIPIDGVWVVFSPDADGTGMEPIETPQFEG